MGIRSGEPHSHENQGHESAGSTRARDQHSEDSFQSVCEFHSFAVWVFCRIVLIGKCTAFSSLSSCGVVWKYSHSRTSVQVRHLRVCTNWLWKEGTHSSEDSSTKWVTIDSLRFVLVWQFVRTKKRFSQRRLYLHPGEDTESLPAKWTSIDRQLLVQLALLDAPTGSYCVCCTA